MILKKETHMRASYFDSKFDRFLGFAIIAIGVVTVFYPVTVHFVL